MPDSQVRTFGTGTKRWQHISTEQFAAWTEASTTFELIFPGAQTGDAIFMMYCTRVSTVENNGMPAGLQAQSFFLEAGDWHTLFFQNWTGHWQALFYKEVGRLDGPLVKESFTGTDPNAFSLAAAVFRPPQPLVMDRPMMQMFEGYDDFWSTFQIPYGGAYFMHWTGALNTNNALFNFPWKRAVDIIQTDDAGSSLHWGEPTYDGEWVGGGSQDSGGAENQGYHLSHAFVLA